MNGLSGFSCRQVAEAAEPKGEKQRVTAKRRERGENQKKRREATPRD